MIKKQYIIIILLLLFAMVSHAQTKLENIGGFQDTTARNDTTKKDSVKNEKIIPSHIKTWHLIDYGAHRQYFNQDTALVFFHIFDPIYQKSISNTYTGNLGGAYESNNFFKRKTNSDFFFYNNFSAYARFPNDFTYYNTTTPYTLLDYSQSENKNTKSETRFNVLHTQNINPKLNFRFIYRTASSDGHYQDQINKFNTFGLNTNYLGDKFVSHFNATFNRTKNEENGGLSTGQDLQEYAETTTYLVNLSDASTSLQNNLIQLTNEYRLGKYEEKETKDKFIEKKFRPITGFIYQIEYSGNEHIYEDDEVAENADFYSNVYLDSTYTKDVARYNRLTNIFQLKVYEAPERKYTFSKYAYIGNDHISANISEAENLLQQRKLNNTFVGGGISRDDGKFWQWNASGKFYLTGFRSGQTELNASVSKPLKIGKDTTTLHLDGAINTLVPDYFIETYTSNNYQWNNQFSNINQILIHSKVEDQEFHFTMGMNYQLTDHYIFMGEQGTPQQGSKELMVLAAYAQKDFISHHWVVRVKGIWQESSQKAYLHLPTISGYLSVNYRTLWSKVMHTVLGFDIRYHSEFYADAYDPVTAHFHWQNQQKIGNFPFINIHANLKLKRTRAFFQIKNAAATLLNGKYWGAPSYPFYRRTFRLGIAWSFYD